MDFSNFPIFNAMAGRMAWLTQRQEVLAENVTNADIPGYKARDLEPLDFAFLLRDSGSGIGVARTSSSHIQGSGDSAIELLSSCEERIDMLVTDVAMPRMDGPTLMGHVRRSNPDIRVVFISGYAEDVFRDEIENDETIIFSPSFFRSANWRTRLRKSWPPSPLRGRPACRPRFHPHPTSPLGISGMFLERINILSLLNNKLHFLLPNRTKHVQITRPEVR